jgi:16S rRNA (adenine1518-N6/adenine1519-N6)-dimethyltransferase
MTERSSSKTPFAKKSFGQNFLVDTNYVEKIVKALDLDPGETVIEIGPGRGALTERLTELAQKVIAIELDRDMVKVLNYKFANNTNLEVLQADVLSVDFGKFVSSDRQAKLVANLPYYISTAVLQRLAEQTSAFSEMVLMFQREVVDRITALPGDKNRGFLTVIVEAYLSVEKLFDVPPTAFRPVPKVWSSVVRITPREADRPVNAPFTSLVSSAFSHKRKTILNNLKSLYPNAEEILRAAGVEPKRRAETLTNQEWRELLDKCPSTSSRTT